MNNVKTSKMNKAKAIFAKATSRKEFIEMAIVEAELSKHGAATYYQNLKNEAKGESLYKYNKTAKSNVETVYTPVNRWIVAKDGKATNCFKSRQLAREFAKLNGLKVVDGQA